MLAVLMFLLNLREALNGLSIIIDRKFFYIFCPSHVQVRLKVFDRVKEIFSTHLFLDCMSVNRRRKQSNKFSNDTKCYTCLTVTHKSFKQFNFQKNHFILCLLARSFQICARHINLSRICNVIRSFSLRLLCCFFPIIGNLDKI